MTYEVNLEGLESLRSAQATQFGYQSGGEMFAMGSCAPGVFDTGVLALFSSQYTEAHGLLMEAMRSATDAADRVRDSLADNLQTYIDDDAESSTSLSALTVEIDVMSLPTHQPHRPDDPIPGLPGPLSWGLEGGLLGLDHWDMPLPDLPPSSIPLTDLDRWVNRQINGSAADPIAMVNELIDLINHSATTGEGIGDLRDYEQYIRENS